MTIIEFAVTTARAFMVAEIAMASVNCGYANVTRAQAEKLLGAYFALVEHAISRIDNNPLDRRSCSSPYSNKTWRDLNDDSQRCALCNAVFLIDDECFKS